MSKQCVFAILGASFASADNWTDDFNECNMYRAVGKGCPEDEHGDAKRFSMIPATQRTNNVAGHALDITPWSTES